MSETYVARNEHKSRFRGIRILGAIFLWLILLLLNLWAVAAIYVDCRISALRIPLAVLYVIAALFLLVWVRRAKALASFACFCVVLAWWLSLTASNDRNWRPDCARTASAGASRARLTAKRV